MFTVAQDYAVNADGSFSATGQQTHPGDDSVKLFSWSVNGNIDPPLKWGFSAFFPGHYHRTFSSLYVGGPFAHALMSSTGTVIDFGFAGFPTSVSNVMIMSSINGTVVSALTQTGDFSTPNGTSVLQKYPLEDAPLNSHAPATGMYQVEVILDVTSMGNDSVVTFGGGFVLLLPEPVSMSLLGSAVAGLALVRRRRVRSGACRCPATGADCTQSAPVRCLVKAEVFFVLAPSRDLAR